MQATHSNRPMSHFGLAAGHCELCVHTTHWLVVGSQNGAVAGQSVADLHPTHAPVVVLQIGVSPRHVTAPSPMHDEPQR
jgi:hypothetical protein